jgi:hypothetical protein
MLLGLALGAVVLSTKWSAEGSSDLGNWIKYVSFSPGKQEEPAIMTWQDMPLVPEKSFSRDL